jgi:hypothetical protein
MIWTLKTQRARRITGNLLFLLLVSWLSVSCKVSDTTSDTTTDASDSSIYVYNLDEDHEYRVELYKNSSDTYVNSFTLSAYPADDSTQRFVGVAEGAYYISIYKDDGTTRTDKSSKFYLEADTYTCFTIDSDGDLANCF